MTERERGVALLQALLLSMIVSLLALQLTLTARDQVATVRLLEERLQADLLTHSLEVEVLFNLLTLEDQAPSFRRSWNTNAESTAITQTFAPAAGVVVTVSDLSGRLPLRYPEHPLWRGTLVQLGMPIGQADGFLATLRDLQGKVRSSNVVGQGLAAPTRRGRSPNQNLQLANEAEYWLGDWNGWMPVIREISHHYPLAEVNQNALAATLRRAAAVVASGQAARSSPSGRAPYLSSNSNAASNPSLSGGTLNPLTQRSLRNSELVSNMSSNYWRVEIDIERPNLIRRVKTDFLLQSLDDPPFLTIDR